MYSPCYTSYVANDKKFAVVQKMLEKKGYELVRINGSHHIFDKPGCNPVSIPVHKRKVKPYYVKHIEKL